MSKRFFILCILTADKVNRMNCFWFACSFHILRHRNNINTVHNIRYMFPHFILYAIPFLLSTMKTFWKINLRYRIDSGIVFIHGLHPGPCQLCRFMVTIWSNMAILRTVYVIIIMCSNVSIWIAIEKEKYIWCSAINEKEE